MEKWFSFIQSVTFETAFLPITRSEGAALQIKIQSMYKGNTNTLDDEQTRILGQVFHGLRYNNLVGRKTGQRNKRV